MRFQVPQFIEVEDKIFGPLTIKQFIYVAGGVGIGIAAWLTLPFVLAVILAAPFVTLGFCLAFLKINDRPFIDVLESAFNYTIGSKLYIWEKKSEKKQAQKETVPQEDATRFVPSLSESKIKDLAWSLDIKESMYSDKNQR